MQTALPPPRKATSSRGLLAVIGVAVMAALVYSLLFMLFSRNLRIPTDQGLVVTTAQSFGVMARLMLNGTIALLVAGALSVAVLGSLGIVRAVWVAVFSSVSLGGILPLTGIFIVRDLIHAAAVAALFVSVYVLYYAIFVRLPVTDWARFVLAGTAVFLSYVGIFLIIRA